jgi:hypothetical protein
MGNPVSSARQSRKLGFVLPAFIGGVAKIVVDLAFGPLLMGRPWGMLRRMAAIVLGRSALGESFGFGQALVGLIVHFALTFLYASLLLVLVRRSSRAAGIAIGALFGLALYVVNLHGFAVLFPWFADVRGLEQLISHALFGVTVALVYAALRPRPTLEELRPEPRRDGMVL